jgi:hypothetical protein
MVRFVRPKKSNFTRPMLATLSMSYWVMTTSSLPRVRGHVVREGGPGR